MKHSDNNWTELDDDFNSERNPEEYAGEWGTDNEDSLWRTSMDSEDDVVELNTKNKIGILEESNSAIFNMFVNYFNTKISNPTINTVEYDKIKVMYSLQPSRFGGTISLPLPIIFKHTYIFKYNEVDIYFNLESIIAHGELAYHLEFESKQPVEVDSKTFYKEMLAIALKHSDLKGKYFTMPENKFTWEVSEIQDSGYEDIFLPDDLMSDSKLYLNLFKKKGILNRYMFSGAPGTGKTELTRIITSLLNAEGVTVIKTTPCELIKEKFELAKILAPSVMIFDDIDLSLGDRNKGGYSKVLGGFLDVLDGVDKIPKNVGVIATTNATHLIDLAAQRPGRFNKILFFDDLSEDNIKGIINKALKHENEKFGEVKEVIQTKLTDDKLVKFFKKVKRPGSYIYETITALIHKLDVEGDEDFNLLDFILRLERDVDRLDKKLSQRMIKNTMDGSSESSLGFKMRN